MVPARVVAPPVVDCHAVSDGRVVEEPSKPLSRAPPVAVKVPFAVQVHIVWLIRLYQLGELRPKHLVAVALGLLKPDGSPVGQHAPKDACLQPLAHLKVYAHAQPVPSRRLEDLADHIAHGPACGRRPAGRRRVARPVRESVAELDNRPHVPRTGRGEERHPLAGVEERRGEGARVDEGHVVRVASVGAAVEPRHRVVAAAAAVRALPEAHAPGRVPLGAAGDVLHDAVVLRGVVRGAAVQRRRLRRQVVPRRHAVHLHARRGGAPRGMPRLRMAVCEGAHQRGTRWELGAPRHGAHALRAACAARARQRTARDAHARTPQCILTPKRDSWNHAGVGRRSSDAHVAVYRVDAPTAATGAPTAATGAPAARAPAGRAADAGTSARKKKSAAAAAAAAAEGATGAARRCIATYRRL